MYTNQYSYTTKMLYVSTKHASEVHKGYCYTKEHAKKVREGFNRAQQATIKAISKKSKWS